MASSSSEALVKSADAGAYAFVDNAWASLDGGLSAMWLFKNKDNSGARLVAKSTNEQKYVINSALGAGCTCSMVSSNFMQWTSGDAMYGANFSDAQVADQFCRRMVQTIDAVTAQTVAAEAQAAEGETDGAQIGEASDGGEGAAAASDVEASDGGADGDGGNATDDGAAEDMAAAQEPATAPADRRTSESQLQTPSPALTPPPSVSTPSDAAPESAAIAAARAMAARRLSSGANSTTASPAMGRKGSTGSASGTPNAAPPVLAGKRDSRAGSDAASGGGVLKMPADAFGGAATKPAATDSPKVGRATLRFGKSNVRASSGSIGGSAPTPLSASAESFSSPTLRFAKKKATNWKEQVESAISPRSSIIRNVDAAAPSSDSLLQRDVAKLSTRERVIKELCTTELSYCKNLQQIVKIAIPMATQLKVFKPEQQDQIFGNVEHVFGVNANLLGRLYAVLVSWNDSTSMVGDVLLSSINTFKPYAKYLANYSSALKLLEELDNKKKPVAAYCQQFQDECGGMTLTGLLVTPVQRIPRYQLLLQEVIKFTPAEHPDLENLNAALVAIKKYAEDMNKTVKMSENRKEFARLSMIIDGLSAIRSSLLWSDDKLKITLGPGENDSCPWMVLFADRLVFVRENAIAAETLLHHTWVKAVSKTNDLTFQVITPDRKILVTAEIPQQKVQWMERIESATEADLVEKEFVDPDMKEGRRFAFKWSLPNNGVAIYQGQWLDARPQGHGKYKYATKAAYEGSFKSGKRFGQGKIVYQTGDSYDGGWDDDLPHGQGSMVSGACEYTGDFLCGAPTGSGTVKHADGSTYTGQFVAGFYAGAGKLVDAFGSSYEGEFKDGVRNGRGKFVGGGVEYEGEWKADRHHGEGRIRYSSGSVYTGTFAEGVPSGSGTLEQLDGTTYTGSFKDGQFDGTGTLKQRDGSIYTGQFSGGVRAGKGQLVHVDGRTYDGDWVAGVRHGQGKWVDPLSKIAYEGAFDSDQYNGRGKLFVDGRVHYDGQWKAGRKEGKGLWQSVDGTIKYTGGFARDRRDGIGVLESGQWKYAGVWQDGRRHGTGEYTGPTYKYEGEWVADRRTGKGKERFPDLHLAFEGDFQDDARVRGKVTIEAPGKMPIAIEVDHEKQNVGMLNRMPPPMTGPQVLIFDF